MFFLWQCQCQCQCQVQVHRNAGVRVTSRCFVSGLRTDWGLRSLNTFSFQNLVFLLPLTEWSSVPPVLSGYPFMVSACCSPPMIEIGVRELSKWALLVFSFRSFLAIFLSDKLRRSEVSFIIACCVWLYEDWGRKGWNQTRESHYKTHWL